MNLVQKRTFLKSRRDWHKARMSWDWMGLCTSNTKLSSISSAASVLKFVFIHVSSSQFWHGLLLFCVLAVLEQWKASSERWHLLLSLCSCSSCGSMICIACAHSLSIFPHVALARRHVSTALLGTQGARSSPAPVHLPGHWYNHQSSCRRWFNPSPSTAAVYHSSQPRLPWLVVAHQCW